MPSRSLTVRTSLLFTLLAAGVFLVMGAFIRASLSCLARDGGQALSSCDA